MPKVRDPYRQHVSLDLGDDVLVRPHRMLLADGVVLQVTRDYVLHRLSLAQGVHKLPRLHQNLDVVLVGEVPGIDDRVVAGVVGLELDVPGGLGLQEGGEEQDPDRSDRPGSGRLVDLGVDSGVADGLLGIRWGKKGHDVDLDPVRVCGRLQTVLGIEECRSLQPGRRLF